MSNNALCRGDEVELVTKPDGCHSQHLPLTVGHVYKVVDLDGSNIVTTTDESGSTASYWRGRVKKVSKK